MKTFAVLAAMTFGITVSFAYMPERINYSGDRENGKWLEMAAEDGVLYAQYSYSECCLSGDGAAYDPVTAVKYLRIAAAQGDPDSMYLLGRCLLSGIGCTKDTVAAKKYLSAAAASGSAYAAKFLKTQSLR